MLAQAQARWTPPAPVHGCSLSAVQQALTLRGFLVLAQAQGAVDTAGTILGQLDTLQGTLDTISRDLPGARGLWTQGLQAGFHPIA